MKRASRQAFTTIEIMVVVALCGVVISLAATLLAQMLHMEGDARRAADESRELARLAIGFRADAHAASKIEIAAGAGKATLRQAGERAIDYIASEGRVERVQRDGEKTSGRDSFQLCGDGLPVVAKIAFESQSVDGQEFAAMAVEWREDLGRRSTTPVKVSRIEARLARDAELIAANPGDEQ